MKIFYLVQENFGCIIYADNENGAFEKMKAQKKRIIRNFRITIRYYTMGNWRIYTRFIWWHLMFLLKWNDDLKMKWRNFYVNWKRNEI